MTDPTPTEIIAERIGRIGADGVTRDLAEHGYRIVGPEDAESIAEALRVAAVVSLTDLMLVGMTIDRGNSARERWGTLAEQWSDNAAPTPDPESPDRPRIAPLPVGNPSSGTDRRSDQNGAQNRHVTITRSEDGALTLDWPENLTTTEIAREVMVDLLNEMERLRDGVEWYRSSWASPLPPPAPTQTTAEVLADLRERLRKADLRLIEECVDPTASTWDRYRLRGKCEGLKLAIDYLRAYEQ